MNLYALTLEWSLQVARVPGSGGPYFEQAPVARADPRTSEIKMETCCTMGRKARGTAQQERMENTALWEYLWVLWGLGFGYWLGFFLRCEYFMYWSK